MKKNEFYENRKNSFYFRQRKCITNEDILNPLVS